MTPRPTERPADPAAPRRPPTSGPDPDLGGLSGEELEVLLRVSDVLRRIRFGSVLITVHDGRVVQIEMAEKIRLR